jgi:beta-N-acetylhexosaminidase
MVAYSQRHYGDSEYRLSDPKVIVEHMTAGTTYSSAWNTFAPNQPDGELGELPGVCAHFIIDSDGKISQLVSLRIRCRHTVGLNWTAIGIEHVGMDGQEVLDSPSLAESSLALTNWLRCRYGIEVRNVIGHNENVASTYHREQVERLKTQTHDDWPKSKMSAYRARLKRLKCA